MEQLIERINKLATAAKATIIGGIILALTGGTYLLLITGIEEKIAMIQSEQQAKDRTLAEKQLIADNLNQTRKDMEELEQRLQAALNQLPEKKDIEELLTRLNEVGKKSGLEINRVTPGAEAAGPEGFYFAIPVMMAVTGNYHEVAMFFQEIANLTRIVKVSDLKLGSPVMKGDKVMLVADFVATTYRFADSKKDSKKEGQK